MASPQTVSRMNLWQRIDQKLGRPPWPWTDRPIPARKGWPLLMLLAMRETERHPIHNRYADLIVSTLVFVAFVWIMWIQFFKFHDWEG